MIMRKRTAKRRPVGRQLDRNVARKILRPIGKRPLTLVELTEVTGLPREIVQTRLAEYCGQGRARGRIVRLPTGAFVVEYRALPRCADAQPQAI